MPVTKIDLPMRTIVVGGFSSGVGKTSIVCRLLEVLSSWGALKTAPLRDASAGAYEIVRDEVTLRGLCRPEPCPWLASLRELRVLPTLHARGGRLEILTPLGRASTLH